MNPGVAAALLASHLGSIEHWQRFNARLEIVPSRSRQFSNQDYQTCRDIDIQLEDAVALAVKKQRRST